MNCEQDLICPECCNIQLLGLDFNEESNNIDNFIDLYSYCIYNHKGANKVNLQKNNFDFIFSNANKSYNNIIYNTELKCESCKRKLVEYHCFECKRNLCKNCIEYHKNHKYYYNYDYLTEDEIEKINNKFDKSKINMKFNLILLEHQILKFEEELNNLKKLYNKYKEINDKLTDFSTYIFNKYNDLLKSKRPINYPIYFNLKNILSFSPMKLNLPENDISIKSFTDILTKKITSGLFFIISNSPLTSNLEKYYKSNKPKINWDIQDITYFTKKEVEYDFIIPLNENKFCGINDPFIIHENQENNLKEEGMVIYNIKNQSIETKIDIVPDSIYYSEKYNLIVLKTEYLLQIYNLRDFTLLQEFEVDENRKRIARRRNGSVLWSGGINGVSVYHEFIHVEFISENIIGFIYEGDLSYLGEEVENLFDMDNNLRIINVENRDYEDYNYEPYSYFIIYQRENKESLYAPKKVSILVKMDIDTNEIPFKVGEYTDNIEEKSYCHFTLDSVTKLSDEGFIIAFKSRIQIPRDQDFFYITDKFYKNGIYYYFLNWKIQKSINYKIGKTKENSYLFKNDIDDKFYFIYNKSKSFAVDLKNFFGKFDFKLITVNVGSKLDIRKLYIEKNNIFGWNKNSIYIGKIISGELEIINNFSFPSNEYVDLISLKNKCIYYSNGNNTLNEDSIIIEDD